MTTAIGIDIGGTKIAGGLVSERGEVSAVRRRPTSRDPEETLAAIAAIVGELRQEADGSGTALAVGIGTGGVVDVDTGVVVAASEVIAGWAGMPLAQEVRRRTGVDAVRVDNDGNTFALAEHHWGAACGVPDALFVAVGTGVGGGVVLEGRLRRGPTLTAGEFGRLPVPMAQEARRTLEDVAAGPSMAARYSLLAGRPGTDLREVARAAARGEEIARQVLEIGARALGRSMATLALALDVPVLVVGGGVSAIGEPYRETVEDELRASGCAASVVLASQGPLSSIAGAGALVLDPAGPGG